MGPATCCPNPWYPVSVPNHVSFKASAEKHNLPSTELCSWLNRRYGVNQMSHWRYVKTLRSVRWTTLALAAFVAPGTSTRCVIRVWMTRCLRFSPRMSHTEGCVRHSVHTLLEANEPWEMSHEMRKRLGWLKTIQDPTLYKTYWFTNNKHCVDTTNLLRDDDWCFVGCYIGVTNLRFKMLRF